MTDAPARRAAHTAALLLLVRTWHAYLGMLIAPATLFFAITGVLQVYSLHENGPGYTAPVVLERLGALHKKQTLAVRAKPSARKAPPEARIGEGGAKSGGAPEPRSREGATAPDGPPGKRPPGPAVLGLKAFFALAAVGLAVSTLAGIWMALRTPAKRPLHLLLLAVGALLPILLAALTA